MSADLNELISNLTSSYKDLSERKQAFNDTLKKLASTFENLEVENPVSSSTSQETSKSLSRTIEKNIIGVTNLPNNKVQSYNKFHHESLSVFKRNKQY